MSSLKSDLHFPSGLGLLVTLCVPNQAENLSAPPHKIPDTFFVLFT